MTRYGPSEPSSSRPARPADACRPDAGCRATGADGLPDEDVPGVLAELRQHQSLSVVRPGHRPFSGPGTSLGPPGCIWRTVRCWLPGLIAAGWRGARGCEDMIGTEQQTPVTAMAMLITQCAVTGRMPRPGPPDVPVRVGHDPARSPAPSRTGSPLRPRSVPPRQLNPGLPPFMYSRCISGYGGCQRFGQTRNVVVRAWSPARNGSRVTVSLFEECRDGLRRADCRCRPDGLMWPASCGWPVCIRSCWNACRSRA